MLMIMFFLNVDWNLDFQENLAAFFSSKSCAKILFNKLLKKIDTFTLKYCLLDVFSMVGSVNSIDFGTLASFRFAT